jgi:hypothetical protein
MVAVTVSVIWLTVETAVSVLGLKYAVSALTGKDFHATNSFR